MTTDNPTAPQTETPIEQLSYEEAFSQLELIVGALEGDEQTLEQAIALYERGQSLIRRCAELLEQADLRVRQLTGEELVDFEP